MAANKMKMKDSNGKESKGCKSSSASCSKGKSCKEETKCGLKSRAPDTLFPSFVATDAKPRASTKAQHSVSNEDEPCILKRKANHNHCQNGEWSQSNKEVSTSRSSRGEDVTSAKCCCCCTSTLCSKLPTPDNPETDTSLIRQPLNLGVANVKQILQCVHHGTPEVKDVILNECNIIYECKACKNLFRSLANFLSHKRFYCTKHFCENMMLFDCSSMNYEERSQKALDSKGKDIPKTLVIGVENQPHGSEIRTENSDGSCCDEKHPSEPKVAKLDKGTISMPLSATAATEVRESHVPDKLALALQKMIGTPAEEDVKNRRFLEACENKVQQDKVKNRKSGISVKLVRIPSNQNAMYQVLSENVHVESSESETGEKIDSLNSYPETSNVSVSDTKPETENSAPKQPAMAASSNGFNIHLSSKLKPASAKPHASGTFQSSKLLNGLPPTFEKNKLKPQNVVTFGKQGSLEPIKDESIDVTKLGLKANDVRHTQVMIYPCPFCHQSFRGIPDAATHMSEAHKKEGDQLKLLQEVVRSRAYLQALSEEEDMETSGDESD